MLAMMKTPRRTPTTIPMVVFVLEVSRFRSSAHLVKCDRLRTCEKASDAGAARAEGGGMMEVSGREESGIYIQCLVLWIWLYVYSVSSGDANDMSSK